MVSTTGKKCPLYVVFLPPSLLYEACQNPSYFRDLSRVSTSQIFSIHLDAENVQSIEVEVILGRRKNLMWPYR